MKDNQKTLIRHLIRFHILDYESCLQVLDTENTGDKVALHQEDKRILQMYPDVLQSERVSVLVYKSSKNADSN